MTFDEFYTRHERRVQVACLRKVPERYAEDVAQEVWMSMYPRFQDARSPRGLLMYIVNSKVAAFYREREHDEECAFGPTHASGQDVEREVEDRLRLQAVGQALSAMRPPRVAVFMAHVTAERRKSLANGYARKTTFDIRQALKRNPACA